MKQNEDHNCIRKLRHTDYWSALRHARSLCAEGLVIYPCRIGGDLHVGHTASWMVKLGAKQKEQKMAALLRRIGRHRQLSQEHDELVQELTLELDRLRLR